MKLLADENIGFSIINPLRKLGYDITSIIEISPGLDDQKVLSIANNENRIIITSDKDFGELIYANKLTHSGIILLRLRNKSAKNKLTILRKLFKTHSKKLMKKFTVVTDTQVRIR